MGVKAEEIIYTSGSSESNNLAIKGICLMYQNRGKHIITTDLEHSSIYGPIDYLLTLGFEVSYVKLTSEGKVDLDDLKRLMRDDTVLVTINSVNSELGIEQPVNEIGELLKNYPKCYFHVDMTQSVGKVNVNCSNIDLISFSAHKFFGLKGIGVLIKKERIEMEPLIHGGKSTTKYRSGTPALPLIVSLAKALRLATENLNNDYKYISELNSYLRSELKKYDKVFVNSPTAAIPHILNISVVGVKPETLLHALEEHDIYISTQSACSSSHSESRAVYAVTGDEARATSSVRISLSKLTTKNELDEFLNIFDTCYVRLTNLR
jgi:cysteine desulfurase